MLLVTELDIRRNCWKRLSSLETEPIAIEKQSICCWKEQWLFVFSKGKSAEAHHVHRLGIRETRKPKWETLVLSFYLLSSFPSLESVFLDESERIALYSWEDINTLVEISKQGAVFPVA